MLFLFLKVMKMAKHTSQSTNDVFNNMVLTLGSNSLYSASILSSTCAVLSEAKGFLFSFDGGMGANFFVSWLGSIVLLLSNGCGVDGRGLFLLGGGCGVKDLCS